MYENRRDITHYWIGIGEKKKGPGRYWKNTPEEITGSVLRATPHTIFTVGRTEPT